MTTGHQVENWKQTTANVLVSKAVCLTEKGAQQLIDDGNKLGLVGSVFNLTSVSILYVIF